VEIKDILHKSLSKRLFWNGIQNFAIAANQPNVVRQRQVENEAVSVDEHVLLTVNR